jgi:uncharacterized OB-fold protein
MSAETKPSPVPERPLPEPSPESKAFWQAAREHRLLLRCCNACGKFWFPPSSICPHCLSDNIGWQDAKGCGHVYSFVVFHRMYHPAFAKEVPYVVAVIELDEGPRLVSNVVGIDPGSVRCGMRVQVTYDDVSPDVTLPKFAAEDELRTP